MVTIPKLYREKEVQILDQVVTIRGYRAGDTDYVVALQRSRNRLIDLVGKLQVFKDLQKRVQATAQDVSEDELESQLLSNIKDDDLTPEEIEELVQAKDEIDQLKADIEETSTKLGQRGLKRFYYQDDEGYMEAERLNRGTQYIDNLPDIEVDPDNLTLIANTMLELGSPTERLVRAADKGKPQKRSKQSKKK